MTELQNHGRLTAEGLVGQEFLVRKQEDNTLGAVVIGALEEQTCPLGDETQICFLNASSEKAEVFFFNEVEDREILVQSIEPNQ